MKSSRGSPIRSYASPNQEVELESLKPGIAGAVGRSTVVYMSSASRNHWEHAQKHADHALHCPASVLAVRGSSRGLIQAVLGCLSPL